MSLRGRLDGVKWCSALGVALVLHAAVFWGLLPQAFPPPFVQPASTRVVLISLSTPEPDVIEDVDVSETPSKAVDPLTPHVAETSPVEVEVNKSEPERETVKLESAYAAVPERKQNSEKEQPIVDEPVFEETPVPFSDSVLAVEDRVDVDGLFDVPPQALQTLEPNYPLAARRKKYEGDVLCEAVITKHGRVEAVHVVSSSGYRELDGAALVALQRARFEPASRRGRSIKATVRITITFRLTGR